MWSLKLTWYFFKGDTMSDQENLNIYTALDDFLHVLRKFVDFSSDAEIWTYHPDKIERNHLLLLLAWPGIFTMRLSSFIAKDEFEKEFEIIETLHREDEKDLINNEKIKSELDKIDQELDRAEELLCEKGKDKRDEVIEIISHIRKKNLFVQECAEGIHIDRNIFEKALYSISKLFETEKDKDVIMYRLQKELRKNGKKYYNKHLEEIVSLENLTNELFEKNEKKYRVQLRKLEKKFIDIVENRNEHQLPKYFEEVNKIWVKLSKELLKQIKEIPDEKRFEKLVLTQNIELFDQYLKLFISNLSELNIDGLDTEDFDSDYLMNLIDKQVRGSTYLCEKLFSDLLFTELKLASEVFSEHQIELKSQIDEISRKSNYDRLFYSVAKPIRKIELIFLFIEHIGKQNTDELYYLFSNYCILFYLFLYFFKAKTKTIYIPFDQIMISNQKSKIISFDPTLKGRYATITDQDLDKIIENSNIETYFKPWLKGVNNLVIDKVNHFRSHHKEITYLSSNRIPSENLFLSKKDLFLHRIKTKENSNFGIVNDKNELDINLDYNSATIAYDINTIEELDYNLWIIPHKVSDSDEIKIGYFFHIKTNEDVNIDEKLLKYLYYIVKRISSITVTFVDSLNKFIDNPAEIKKNKNLDGYEECINKLTERYRWLEEFLRSNKLSSAVYKVNSELFDDDDKFIEKATKKLRKALRKHAPIDLQITLKEADIELNDILNNTHGVSKVEKKKSAEKYWKSRSFQHITEKELNLMNFENADKSVNKRNSRTQIFPSVADDKGYNISGNMGFELLGIPR